MASLVEIWKEEPNQHGFTYKGFECVIARHPELLHFCGYVVCNKSDLSEDYDVHGGITFQGILDHIGLAKLAVGFDCAHCDDISPGMLKYTHEESSNYRTYKHIGYVILECQKLVDQILERRSQLSKEVLQITEKD